MLLPLPAGWIKPFAKKNEFVFNLTNFSTALYYEYLWRIAVQGMDAPIQGVFYFWQDLRI